MVTAISLLKSSEYRLKIVKAIGKDTVTPSEIAEKIGIRLNHVSTFLKELCLSTPSLERIFQWNLRR